MARLIGCSSLFHSEAKSNVFDETLNFPAKGGCGLGSFFSFGCLCVIIQDHRI